MRLAPLSINEPDRLAALAEYQLKEDDSTLELDDIVQLAKRLFDVPIVLVSIVEQERQFFSARVGVDVCETGLDVSFCAHALTLDDILVIPDARLDVRFAQNPLVLGEPFVRFYAGMPLITPRGHALGTLCIIDRRPRNGLSPQDRQHLRALTTSTMSISNCSRIMPRIPTMLRSSDSVLNSPELNTRRGVLAGLSTLISSVNSDLPVKLINKWPN